MRLGKLFAISCLSATFPALWASVTVQKRSATVPLGSPCQPGKSPISTNSAGALFFHDNRIITVVKRRALIHGGPYAYEKVSSHSIRAGEINTAEIELKGPSVGDRANGSSSTSFFRSSTIMSAKAINIPGPHVGAKSALRTFPIQTSRGGRVVIPSEDRFLLRPFREARRDS
jgi:hypothetical protein